MLIDGKKIASDIYRQLKAEVDKLAFQPLFCDMIVGEDPVALSYVKIKGKAAMALDLEFKQIQLPQNVSQGELVAEIEKMNILPRMSGLIIQLPLPEHLDRDKVLSTINPRVDVDCIGLENTRKFYADQSALVPPTAAAVMKILDSLPVDLENKLIVVIGQGDLVGKPVTHLLKKRNVRVETADRTTQNLASLTLSADVIISGTGQPNLITGNMVKDGAVIIDAGTAESSGGIVGDVDSQSVAPKAGFLSPVPGGVGPVTVSMLLSNVISAATNSHG